ncbi:Noelin [Holothuria leucospilota]|uniref:Noelin n=1 Tax=Holothuria leucospilota TaxID=206669 RepID=A0A9Q1CBD6_HOLLE|nr:Noelin [Holothuria leucospilota]
MFVSVTSKLFLAIVMSSIFEPHGNMAFGATVLTEDTESGFAVNSSTNGNPDECVCNVHVPTTIQCTRVTNSATTALIAHLQEQISELTAQVSNHVVLYRAQTERLDSLSATVLTTLDTLGRIEAGTLIVSRPEIVQIREELNDIEAVLLTLRQNNASLAAITQIQAEILNVTTLLDELEIQENADTSDLLRQIEGLKARLQECRDSEVTTALYDLWDQEGKQVNSRHLEPIFIEFSCLDTCSELVAVSLPYTVSGLRPTYGSWFRDPLENRRRVFSYEMPNGRYAQTLNAYRSLKDFHDNRDVTTVSFRPDYSQGTGLVAYNGSLYYNIWNSGNLGRFDVRVNRKLVTKSLPGASYSSEYPYRSGAYSDIDILVDESGLWAVYSSSAANGFILISKLDPDTLDVVQTWQTNYPKNAAGNCFIVCEVLYCTNGFDSHINRINYKYDTKTEAEDFLEIPFDNKFLKTYSLNYNPYDQKLYGWDNGHQMIYDLVFRSHTEEEETQI